MERSCKSGRKSDSDRHTGSALQVRIPQYGEARVITLATAIHFNLPINTPEVRIPFGDASPEGGVTMNDTRTWALFMNGVRARILRGLANVGGEEHVEIVSRASLRHIRDVLAELSDPSDEEQKQAQSNAVIRDMQDFAAETGEFLEQHRRAGDFARLAVFATPPMLAILRTELSATLRTAIVFEQEVNLINLPGR